MTALEFKAWPKIPRLNRGMVITEKIDGTNAAIHIVATTAKELADDLAVGIFHEGMVELDDDVLFIVGAQSRKRLITPEDDNFGFARWVRDNKQALALHLGEGIHYGEWWGSGIQRGYGLEKGTKRFSLFNVKRYADVYLPEIGLGLVPVLYEGQFSTDRVAGIVDSLEFSGSSAAPGFMNPEGVVVFLAAANSLFKVTIKGDEKPKGQVA